MINRKVLINKIFLYQINLARKLIIEFQTLFNDWNVNKISIYKIEDLIY